MHPLRCGLIGYGAWGHHHARVITGNPQAQLVAIAARSAETRARAQHDHPKARVCADYQELLARDDIDAVAVVLPSHRHAEAGLDVVRSGRHLLLEKPMALSVADCEALNAAAKEAGKVLAVGHEMRLSSLWGRVKELIAAGALGEPLYVLVELWRRAYRAGSDGWRYDINRVGNWILEEPIHFFDLARWYFEGLAEPVSVYARGNGRSAEHPELRDHFSATVEFRGGRFAVIAQCLGGWEHHQVVKVSGREGSLWASWSGTMDRTFEPTFWLRLQRGSTLEEAPIARAAGEVFELESQFARFVHAVHSGAPPAATGEDGAAAVRLCLAAQESIERSRPVVV